MASAADENHESGVEFIVEDDGSITARDLETGLARGGETKAEALSQLAEVLALHEGGGEPIEDPDAFLADEAGLDADDVQAARDEADELPDFLQ
ncbi:type II toxin-antitoxin system HicB family antitoxin [Halobaculum sp. P14]|uniref:type II toxin-antitoxin system HicB family antitoxin n=1 Tax=Halobaculum sp. P14 TaxID=3421638 RepID=UPI003EBB5F5B